MKAKSKLWVVFEVSYIVDKKSVNRVLNRALILKKIVGKTVLPIVIRKEYIVPVEEIEKRRVIAL